MASDSKNSTTVALIGAGATVLTAFFSGLFMWLSASGSDAPKPAKAPVPAPPAAQATTHGDASPAVQGAGGDVNINIEYGTQ